MLSVFASSETSADPIWEHLEHAFFTSVFALVNYVFPPLVKHFFISLCFTAPVDQQNATKPLA